MKKKTLLLALLCNCLLFAQDFSVDGISYTITSATSPYTVEASDYDERSTNVVIPSTVINTSITYNVTTIGNSAFYRNSLTSITIPDSVITIGEDAFRDNSLMSVIIPYGVITIDENAFSFNSLSSVTIPDSVTTINSTAFYGNFLESVTIPQSVTTIGAEAFRSNSLTSVISLSLNPATLSALALGSNYSNIDLYIPVGTTAAYNAAGWTGFKSITEDSNLSINDNIILENVSFSMDTNQDTILVKTTNALRIERISLYNISGQHVLVSQQAEISISNLASGIYIAHLTTNLGTVSKKFIK